MIYPFFSYWYNTQFNFMVESVPSFGKSLIMSSKNFFQETIPLLSNDSILICGDYSDC